MEWAKPKYSKGKVDRAGKAFVDASHDTDQYIDALEIINNWRASHIYNGLYIEIQIRSRLQHAWATAVETVGTFLTQPLKSSLGEEKWLRFFAVMGSVIALREGSAALVPGTPTTKMALIEELRAITEELDVIGTLKMFGEALNVGEQATAKGNHFFLLKLEPTEQRMTVTGFSRKQLDEASKQYLEVEKEIADRSWIGL